MPRKKAVVPTHCTHQDKRGLCYACSVEHARNPLVDWLLEQKPAPYHPKNNGRNHAGERESAEGFSRHRKVRAGATPPRGERGRKPSVTGPIRVYRGFK